MGDSISFHYYNGQGDCPVSGVFDGADSLGIKLQGGEYYHGVHIDADSIEKEKT